MSIDKQKLKIVAISFLDNLDKKNLSILMLISILDKSILDITIISTYTYYIACKLEKA